ncbi:MAG: hypothetical protein SVX43_07090 [Cyanobacteriota bacterium]|nr:hypothetical protein [Cyanobacteriota bacterium]
MENQHSELTRQSQGCCCLCQPYYWSGRELSEKATPQVGVPPIASQPTSELAWFAVGALGTASSPERDRASK